MKNLENNLCENSNNTQSCKKSNEYSFWCDLGEKPFVDGLVECLKDVGFTDLPVGDGSVPFDKLCDPNCKFKDPATGYCSFDVVKRLENEGNTLAAADVLMKLVYHQGCNVASFYFQNWWCGPHPESKNQGRYIYNFAVLFLLDPDVTLADVKSYLKRAQKLGNKEASVLLKRLK